VASFKPIELTVHFEGVAGKVGSETNATFSSSALQFAAVNIPLFGGSRNIRLPWILINDGLLDFVIVEPLTLAELHLLAKEIASRLESLAGPRSAESDIIEMGLLSLPGIRYYTARAAHIESSEPLEITLDGEVAARSPVTIRAAPKAVSVLLTKEAQAALGS
jgi:diacylglycerol kinase family enzyme